jgi:hypothetical protein
MQVTRLDGKGNIELYHKATDQWFYWIPCSEVTTRRGVLRWIEHLSEKNWVTPEHIYQLLEISKSLKAY